MHGKGKVGITDVSYAKHTYLGYHACDNGSLTDGPRDPDGRQLQYFSHYEPAFHALQKIVMDRQWLKSLKFYTRFQ